MNDSTPDDSRASPSFFTCKPPNVDTLYKVVAEHFGVEVDTLSPRTRLDDDLHADATDLEELRMDYEEATNTTVLHDFNSAATLQDILDILAK